MKLSRNILLIGLIGGVLIFCMLNDCSIKEGMKGDKKKGGIMKAVGGVVKNVGKSAVNTAKGAAVGALNETARAVGKSVNAVATAGKILKNEAVGNGKK
tara:strand:- start:2888 stop:3184 length:297 start_codon:yes stop_codon:yes gene_type:complete